MVIALLGARFFRFAFEAPTLACRLAPSYAQTPRRVGSFSSWKER
jgi:hypothetical protein